MKLCKRSLTLTLALLLCAAFASAGTGQIQFQLLNQTGAISNTTVFSPSADTDYILSATGCWPTYSFLTWTDVQGNNQFVEMYSPSSPIAIRVKGGTSPYVGSLGASGCPSTYSLFLEGIEINTASDQQGGITEPYSHDWVSQTAALPVTTLFTAPSTGDYLVSTDAFSFSGDETLTVQLNWTDETGTARAGGSFYGPAGGSPNSHAVSMRVQSGSSVTMTSTQGSGTSIGFNLSVRALRFDTPASGAGPLTSTELDLVNTSTVTYPNSDTVLTIPSSAEYFLVGVLAPTMNNCAGPPSGTATYSARFYANGVQITNLVGYQIDGFLAQQHEGGSTGYRFLTNTYQTNGCAFQGGANYTVSGAAVSF